MMGTIDETEAVIQQARNLRRDTEELLVATLRTTLKTVGTICTLAQQETGEEREFHLQKAENGLQMVTKMAKGIRLTPQDREAIKQARRDLLSLRGQIDPGN